MLATACGDAVSGAGRDDPGNPLVARVGHIRLG
jgi:hypothetical protein